GSPQDTPRSDALLIGAQCDRGDHAGHPGLAVSARTGKGMDNLVAALLRQARTLLPGEGEYALYARPREAAAALHRHLSAAGHTTDLLVLAEALRQARRAIDALTGRAGTEDMLDRLFSGFCIGK